MVHPTRRVPERYIRKCLDLVDLINGQSLGEELMRWALNRMSCLSNGTEAGIRGLNSNVQCCMPMLTKIAMKFKSLDGGTESTWVSVALLSYLPGHTIV